MKVSMNGLRKSLSGDVKSLRDIVESVVRDDFYENEDLVEALNAVVRDINVLNCVFDKDDPDFIEMADIEVEIIEL